MCACLSGGCSACCPGLIRNPRPTPRSWVPGDVAMVDGDVALRTDSLGGGWRRRDAHLIVDAKVERDDLSVRPLLAIDIEDRRQVGRLVNAFLDHLPEGFPSVGQQDDAMRAALRELLNKPAEPQHLAAVVRDDSGVLYIRDKTTTTVAHWKRAEGKDGGQRYKWADLNVSTPDQILSAGWVEDGAS